MEHLTISVWALALLIFVALAFDFMNGFHDGANSISTIVATGALTPKQAVLFAAFFNFAALWVFHLSVAATIGKGTVNPTFVDHYVIFGALMGALAWNIITWYYGLPSSSSHALIGGLIGAVVAKVGTVGLIDSGIGKTLVFIVVSPALGFLLGGLLMLAVSWLYRRSAPSRVDRWFRRLQLFSAGYYSLGHGANDAQKTIGVIWLLMISGGYLAADAKRPPDWVILSCYVAIALGTLLGGWRIVKTMGTKITKLQPVGGFCAETAGAITIVGATLGGIPVSTTHTITGAIMGVGATRRLSAVKWGVAGRILWAWILTIPIAAAVAALCYPIIVRLLD